MPRIITSLNKLLLVCLILPALALGVPTEPLKTAIDSEASTSQEAVFKIGAILALSGAHAPQGNQLRQAIELAVTDVRSKSGLNGPGIELIVLDSGTPTALDASQGSPSTGQSLAELIKKLVLEKKVQVIIGDVTPELSQPLVTLANTYRTVLISPSLQESLNLPENSYAFGLYPRQIGVLGAANRFFELNYEVKSIAVFCDSSLRGSAFLPLIREVARSRQVRILSENCSSEIGRDNRAGVLRAQAESPDAVIVDRDLEQILNLMGRFGWSAPVLTTNLLADALARGSASPALFEGVFSVGWNIESDFIKQFQSAYGTTPNLIAALGYDAVQIGMAGYVSSPEDLRAGLRQLRRQGVAGIYDFTLEQAGNGEQAKLFKVAQGTKTEQ